MAFDEAIPDGWWPSALAEFAKEKPLQDEYVVVAETSEPWGERSCKRLFTALVPTERMELLREHRGCIGHEVSSSGPWPSGYDGTFNYAPHFWVYGIDQHEYLEPLVVSWHSAGKTVFLPDQGFLMTYGLLPRYCESGEIFWDEPRNRVFGVVHCEPPAEYRYHLVQESRVFVRRDYLIDYATVRQMSIIQVYYVDNWTATPDQISNRLQDAASGDVKLPQRMVAICRSGWDKNHTLAKVWGFRHLLEPTTAPVSEDNDYGRLDWPGYGVVERKDDDSMHQLPRACEYVYVKDEVLGEYEGQQGFEITPEKGAVSYDGQWSVWATDRIGRDIIRLELKKLYEGNRPETVRTWFKHCVEPPPDEDIQKLYLEPNIASRSKAIVGRLVDLGETLAGIAGRALGSSYICKDAVGLDRGELNYHGWWKEKAIEPIAFHAPLQLTEADFMARCVDLYKLVGESPSQSLLRTTLKTLGIPAKEVKRDNSIFLLQRLVELCAIATLTGLDLFTECDEIEQRRKTSKPSTAMPILHALRVLRNSKSHKDLDAGTALKDLGICVQQMKPGWGTAVDITYDKTAAALLEITRTLRQILQSP